MKIAVLILGALVATAFADHKNEHGMPNMPDLNQLNNMFGGQMPQIPEGMKIEDLKDAFYSMPPAMKEKLNDMAESMGVKFDDIEDALNNPPEKLKEVFENGGLNAAAQGMFNVPGTEQPEGQAPPMGGMPNIGDMLKNVDMGAMADMMKNVDINSLMENVDMGAMGNMLKGVDVNSIMKNMDMGAMSDMMKNVDMDKISGMMKNMDLGAMGNMMKNVDIKGLMENVDMGAMGDMMKNVDVEGLMQGMDMGPMAGMAGMLKGMDLKSIKGMMKHIDPGMIQNMMKGMDLGPMGNMLKHVDMKAIGGLLHGGKMPSLKDIKEMAGIPEDASLQDVRGMIRDKMEAVGIPTDDPMEAMSVIANKMKGLPLPEGMDPSAMLNQMHGQLEAMGMPEDPREIKGFLLKKLGIPEDIKSIEDLKNPDVIAQLMQRNVFKMMGIDADEDPKVVKDRIVEQLLEEAEKMGAKLPKDLTQEEMLTHLDKMLSGKLNDMVGLETESIYPDKLIEAAKAKLGKLGLNDFGSIKKHVMGMAMKHLMKKVSGMAMHMMMNKMMGGGKQHGPEMRPHMPPRMPPMMPHMMPHMMPMMPPHMMQPMPIDLDLEIEVNVEQPEQQVIPMPSYLHGAEAAVHHPELEDMSDEQLFHHIMAVREGLRSGEMAEDVLQEMIEDLMQARLRARVLSVRNMFLTDRLEAAEEELEMLKQPAVPVRAPARSPKSQLLQALMRPRVL